jgi:coenzyme F420-reducing hydrogenase gamma subunit
MFNAVMSALLVVAGGACAMTGYVIGSWRQRRVLDVELEREEHDSRERFLDLLENLLDEDGNPRDKRPN